MTDARVMVDRIVFTDPAVTPERAQRIRDLVRTHVERGLRAAADAPRPSDREQVLDPRGPSWGADDRTVAEALARAVLDAVRGGADGA